MTELGKLLREATQQVLDLVAGRTSFAEFVARYDSFYHRCGIDGFDCPPEHRRELEEFPQLVEFHRQIEEIVDKSYASKLISPEAYRLAGRLSESEAASAIVAFVRGLDVDKMLLTLDARP